MCGTRRGTGMPFWHATTDDGRMTPVLAREVRNEPQQDGRLTGVRST